MPIRPDEKTEAEGAPEAALQKISTEEIDVRSLVTSAIAAITTQAGDTAARIKAIDDFIAANPGQAEEMRSMIVAEVERNPRLLGEMNFWVTLSGQGGGSTCFDAVLKHLINKYAGGELDAENVKTLPAELLTTVMGQVRRKGTAETYGTVYEKVKEMNRHAIDRFENDETPPARATVSRLQYEEHMAAFYAGDLDTSEKIALASVPNALKGGRIAGALQAYDNVYGLIYPRQGKHAEGRAGCEKVIERAFAELNATKDPEQITWLPRVIMNAMDHIVTMAQETGDVEAVNTYMQKLRQNPVFTAALASKLQWATDLDKKAQSYIDQHPTGK